MGFAKKLGEFARAANALFPPREREPTIAEDYPQKWAEIRRRRLILKITYSAIAAFFVFLFMARLWLGAAVIQQLQPSIWLFFPFMGIIIYFAEMFKCPRCHRTFHAHSRYSAVSDDKARCQHCDLQIAGAPMRNVVE